MIAFLKGIVEMKSQNFIVINVNNVGFKVYMSESAIEQIMLREEIKVYTYMRVMQDDISLYGFLNNEELAMFELLISVGGIGAKSAVAILSNIEPSSFALAVITDDVATLKKLPGIGAKTAQRIILELKDKIKASDAIAPADAEKKRELDEKAKDAIEALQVLGYTRKEIEKAIEKVDTKDVEIEDIIKVGLRNLAS